MSYEIMDKTHQYTDVMFEYIPMAVALFDAQDLRLLAANSLFESLLEPHWQDGKAIGLPPTNWLSDQEASEFMSILRKVAETSSPYRALNDEFPAFKQKLAEWKWTIDPAYDGKGRIMHLVVTVNKTVTTLRSSDSVDYKRRQLKAMVEQYKREFLSIASHELRTPVTAIQGLAEILQLQVARGQSLDFPRNMDALNRITEQSKRLTRLIEEILDLTRIENAQLLLDLAPHDLLQTITQTIQSYCSPVKRHSISLVLQGLTREDTVPGIFDEERITQVLHNLISNAIKYSPTGSKIEIGLRYSPVTPDEALIWVKDEGIGIATHELPHIFDRFHRASNLDRSISGLGIGLYLVREFILRHGGRVWVESNESRGSTFFVNLPLQLAK